MTKYRIQNIIYFEDYGLYARCQLEAIKKSQKIATFIADCIEAYLAKQNVSEKIKNSQTLYAACQKQAQKEGVSIAEFTEKACADFIGVTTKIAAEPQKKGSFFDLNRGVS